ncbi:centrosomal protein of 128 kDa isoform X2 [Gouania willdenowi]|uniref:Centrosomal protein 128 n=1 Tax=Gouania willdenowi TaxID=441366 RepID=A0A8C5HKN2_GOUWI|nr:centrosomal protein of 128 kDa isoform X2 [Gouania willdenowi]
MDTSSDCDSDRTRTRRPRGRRSDRSGLRFADNGAEGRAPDLTQEIGTLGNILQDASRNLKKVDKMLGQYREHTDDQAEAMALLRVNLEDSISQLQKQRGSRSNGALGGSFSGSTIHTSDLEASASEGLTSPQRHFTNIPERRKRSQSASVRFKGSSLTGDDLHRFHHSLRDLRSNQQRLSEDLDREVFRRNRSDLDTRQAIESLTEHSTSSKKQDSVSSRVEQRLRELERERRPEQRGAVLDEQPENLERRHDLEDAMTARLLRAERERSKMEQELERTRRLLEQSEDGREFLVRQVDDVRGELQRTKKEKTGLQRAMLESSQSTAQDRARGNVPGPAAADRADLEKEVAELRVQLCKLSVHGEVEELRRALDLKEKEKIQLSLQVKDLSSELAGREQQQLRMLEQLNCIQSRGQAERREAEALLQESTRGREELKSRAQEAVRQWRAKCRRLQKELEEAKAQTHLYTDKVSQAARDKESSQAQLKVLTQQVEVARRELAEILGRLAMRDEELHRKDVEVSEARQRYMSLQEETREVREAKVALEEEAHRQAAVQARLREENQRLEERADTIERRYQRERDAQVEMQTSLNQMTAAHSQVSQQLAQEQSSRKWLQKENLELQTNVTTLQEERDALSKQLQLEREVHQKELDNLKALMEDSRIRKDREAQDMLKLYDQEREEMQAYLKEAKADSASDKEVCGALRHKLDRMKDECDKLAAQLTSKEEAHSILQRKCQLLKQELEDKVKSRERRHNSESERVKLEQKVIQMESEQEVVLTSMGEELDVACRSLARNGEDKLQVISQSPGLVKDPHRWLAETKTKLRWLCEEVRERDTREQRLRKQHQQTKDQLKALRHSVDSEKEGLLQRVEEQEKLLRSISTERKELLEKSRQKEEEIRILQEHVLDLESNTKAALDHLETIPEKQSLLDNFRDLEESQQQKEKMEQCYTKYREVVCDLQHQLDESKRRLQEYKEEKLDATTRSLRLTALSSSLRSPATFFCSSLDSEAQYSHKRPTTSVLDHPLTDPSNPK